MAPNIDFADPRVLYGGIYFVPHKNLLAFLNFYRIYIQDSDIFVPRFWRPRDLSRGKGYEVEFTFSKPA